MAWGLPQASLGWGDLPAHRGTLHQLVGRHHLHVEVLHLGLAPGLDEPLQDLGRGDEGDGTKGGSRSPPPPAPEPRSPLTLGEDTLT